MVSERGFRLCMVEWLPLSEPNDFTNLALQINHPRFFSFKPKTQKKKKKKKKRISLSLSLCVCMCICFLSSFLIYDSFSLSLSGHNNERGYDDGFVNVKSVEVSVIAKKGPFYFAGRSRWSLCEFLSHLGNRFLL